MSSVDTAYRRNLPDRRRAPTSVLSVFRLYGRRRSFRRRHEGINQYVDQLSPQVVGLALTIVILSALDGLFTLLLLQRDGNVVEANPVMNFALVEGVAIFLLAKGVLTICGVFFLVVHQNFKGSVTALRLLTLGYVVLTLYHVYLFSRLI